LEEENQMIAFSNPPASPFRKGGITKRYPAVKKLLPSFLKRERLQIIFSPSNHTCL
jgi:hypothetical protein